MISLYHKVCVTVALGGTVPAIPPDYYGCRPVQNSVRQDWHASNQQCTTCTLIQRLHSGVIFYCVQQGGVVFEKNVDTCQVAMQLQCQCQFNSIKNFPFLCCFFSWRRALEKFRLLPLTQQNKNFFRKPFLKLRQEGM